MENLFAYGTLMCEDIMQDVAGCRLSCVPAELRGYSRRRVRGEHYPALVEGRPAEGASLELAGDGSVKVGLRRYPSVL